MPRSAIRPVVAFVLQPALIAAAMLLATADATLAQAVPIPVAITTEGGGPLSLGALVGAIVAGGYALRERFKQD